MLRIFGLCCVLSLTLASGVVRALGGDFTLTADDKSTYSLSDSRGQAVVIAFGFTFCPDVCPTALATIGSALRELGDAAERVDALFVSLDPDRDKPEILQQYTRFFHPRLRGLTGSADQVREVAEQYRVRYAFVGKGETDRYTLDHSANLFVVGRDGKLLKIIPHGLPPKVLVDGLREALSTAQPAAALTAR